MSIVEGWAVTDNGSIDISTIAIKRRSSIVSWLIARSYTINPGDTDIEVEQLWNEHHGIAHVVPIIITIKQ
jgi:hypothetical protein